MARKTVYYRVHEHAIQTYIQPAGEVTILINKVLGDARGNAKKLVPVRTGRLRDNIRIAEWAKQKNGSEVSGAVYANIGHAYYVERGTIGPIVAKKPQKGKARPLLKVPRTPGPTRGAGLPSGAVFFAKSVSGQRAQKYLERGLRMAMRQQTTLAMHVSTPSVG